MTDKITERLWVRTSRNDGQTALNGYSVWKTNKSVKIIGDSKKLPFTPNRKGSSEVVTPILTR